MTLSASLPTEDASGNPIDDTRRIFGGMVATAADGTPRLGVIDPDPSTPLVTGTTSMDYLIKGDVLFVTQRDLSTGGVELSANDAVASVATTTAPVANSRIDVIWIKCQFDVYGDSGLYAPTFGVTQGTADASPSVPSIPTGATALAHAEVTSTDTTTETVVITQVAPFTAMAGGVVTARNSTELDAWEPADGALAYQIDTDQHWRRTGSEWSILTGLVLLGRTSFTAVGTPSLDGVFSAAFSNYLILFNIRSMSAGGQVAMRLRAGGVAASGASDYVAVSQSNPDSTITGAKTASSSAPLTKANVSSVHASLQLFDPAVAARTFGLIGSHGYGGTGNAEHGDISFQHQQTVSYDGIGLITSGPSMTGEIAVYGYA